MKRLARRLRHNLGLKLLSLALALLLWSFVHGAKVIEREHRIPIRYVGLADSLLFMETPPQEMRVLVSGPAQELILRLDLLGGASARIDLTAATASLDRLVPSLSDIEAPANERVAVVRVLEPSVIALRLARRIERELPVRLQVDDDPKRTTCLADTPRVEPQRARCIGPEPVLQAMQAIATQPLVLHARLGAAQAVIGLAAAAGVRCIPERVTVRYSVERRRLRTLAAIPVTLVPPARAGWRVEIGVEQARLRVAGPEVRVAALEDEDIGLFVDASRLAPGHHAKVEILAQLPAWIELVDLEPHAVDLTVLGPPGSASADSLLQPGTDVP